MKYSYIYISYISGISCLSCFRQQYHAVWMSGVWSPGFGPESALSVSSGLLCNFFTVYLTFMQIILQLKLCFYTTMYFLLEECRISLKSSLSTQSVCHTISSRVGVQAFIRAGVWSLKFSNPGVGVRV